MAKPMIRARIPPVKVATSKLIPLTLMLELSSMDDLTLFQNPIFLNLNIPISIINS